MVFSRLNQNSLRRLEERLALVFLLGKKISKNLAGYTQYARGSFSAIFEHFTYNLAVEP